MWRSPTRASLSLPLHLLTWRSLSLSLYLASDRAAYQFEEPSGWRIERRTGGRVRRSGGCRGTSARRALPRAAQRCGWPLLLPRPQLRSTAPARAAPDTAALAPVTLCAYACASRPPWLGSPSTGEPCHFGGGDFEHILLLHASWLLMLLSSMLCDVGPRRKGVLVSSKLICAD